MKLKYIIKSCSLIAASLFWSACVNLDQDPMSTIPPENYPLTSETQLETYANNLYAPRNNNDNGNDQTFPVHSTWSYGTFAIDNNTDNMSSKSYDNKYIPGEWRVGQSGGDWYFDIIYKCNYFLERVKPRLNANTISGNIIKVKQYVGEVYFFRAYEYFKRLQSIGDFPIITNTYPNEMDALTAISKRAPRTEVAHLILSDLDSAIKYLGTTPDTKKNRISQYVAQQFKSRVALFEGTWLKYFKGTAFVPNGPDWPGAQKDYNKNYKFPKGSIDAEIAFFFTEAMNAAKAVADNIKLVDNNGVLQQTTADPENKYLKMFGDVDLSPYSEVLLWREYSRAQGFTHNVPIAAQLGTYVVGLTRGFVDNFIMSNGLPIYASGSNYEGDNYITDVRKNRDGRLWLFLKEPGQKNIIFNESLATRGNLVEGYPNITSSDGEKGYGTGYTLRKGGTFDGAQLTDNNGCYTGAIVFRAVESYLNYIEACYEQSGALDATAQKYWELIRARAKVDINFGKTIAATDMNKEALNDWGAYSAGNLIDPTLYNIRRERRCELMAEGLRMMDLKRWRALDQLIKAPYHIEGFKLWGPMQNWYVDDKGKSTLVYGNNDPNVSAPEQSIYLRPQETNPKSLIYGKGCSWAMAHYLSPIAIQHFLITGGVDNSPIYQNPYWPTTANQGAIK